LAPILGVSAMALLKRLHDLPNQQTIVLPERKTPTIYAKN